MSNNNQQIIKKSKLELISLDNDNQQIVPITPRSSRRTRIHSEISFMEHSEENISYSDEDTTTDSEDYIYERSKKNNSKHLKRNYQLNNHSDNIHYDNHSDISSISYERSEIDNSPFIVRERGFIPSNHATDDNHEERSSTENSSIDINTINLNIVQENLNNNYFTLADFEEKDLCLYNIFSLCNLLIFVDNDRISRRNKFFFKKKNNLRKEKFPGCTFIAYEKLNYIKKYIHELNTLIANYEVKNMKIKSENEYCNSIYFDEGNIKKNTVYKKMEVMNKFLFVPLNKYQIKQTEYKIRGFCQIAEELGAKEIEIKFNQSKSENKDRKMILNLNTQIDLFAGELGLVNNSEDKNNQEYLLEYPAINTITLNEKSIIKKIRKRMFIISEDMYNSNLELQYLVHSRCRHFIEKYSTVFTLDSSINIDKSLKTKFKIHGLGLGTEFKISNKKNNCVKIITNVKFSSKDDYYNNLGGYSVSLDKIGFKYLIDSFDDENKEICESNFKTHGVYKIMNFIELYVDKVIKHKRKSRYKFIKKILYQVKKNLTLIEYAEILCNYFSPESQWVHFINFMDILSNKSQAYDKLGYIIIINDTRLTEEERYDSIIKFIQERCIYITRQVCDINDNICIYYKDLEKKFWEMLKPHRRDLKFLLKDKLDKEYDFVEVFNWYGIECLINNINKYTINLSNNDNMIFKQLITNMNFGYRQLEFYENILPFIIRYSQHINYENPNIYLLSNLLEESISYESFTLSKIQNLNELEKFIISKTERIERLFSIIENIKLYNIPSEDCKDNIYYKIYNFIKTDIVTKYPYFNKKINIIFKTLDEYIIQDYIEDNKYNLRKVSQFYMKKGNTSAYSNLSTDNLNKEMRSDINDTNLLRPKSVNTMKTEQDNDTIILGFFKKILLYNEKLYYDNIPLNTFGFQLLKKNYNNGIKSDEYYKSVIPYINKLTKTIIMHNFTKNSHDSKLLSQLDISDKITFDYFDNNINNFYDLVVTITEYLDAYTNNNQLNNEVVNKLCFN
jgi:hypothetical protein